MVKRLTPNPAAIRATDGRRACRSYGPPLADARRDRRRQIQTVGFRAFTLGGPTWTPNSTSTRQAQRTPQARQYGLTVCPA